MNLIKSRGNVKKNRVKKQANHMHENISLQAFPAPCSLFVFLTEIGANNWNFAPLFLRIFLLCILKIPL